VFAAGFRGDAPVAEQRYMSIPQQSVLGDYETTANSQQKPRIIRSDSGSERERKRQGKEEEVEEKGREMLALAHLRIEA
jgi:hypothetical protein